MSKVWELLIKAWHFANFKWKMYRHTNKEMLKQITDNIILLQLLKTSLDPPRFDLEDLSAFTEPKTVKVGHNAIFKLHFLGHKPIKIQWFREGEELQDDNNTRIEKSASQSRLLLSRCQRKDTGEIKIKLKNEHGFTEALSRLIVLGEWIMDNAEAEQIDIGFKQQ